MRRIIIFVLLTIIVAACSNQNDNTEKALEQVLTIEDPWIRPAGQGMNTGAFFKVINNTAQDDTLYEAEFEPADVVQIHSSFKTEDGRMGMKHEPFAVIEAHSTFLFKPMSYHVMLIRLKQDLKVDETYKLKLFFKRAGEVTVNAVVRDMPKIKH